MKIQISAKAEAELKAAYDWHSSIDPELAAHFQNHFSDTVRRMKQFPFAHKQIRDGLRKIVFRVFPYSIYYTLDKSKDEIIILSVSHFKRRPKE